MKYDRLMCQVIKRFSKANEDMYQRRVVQQWQTIFGESYRRVGTENGEGLERWIFRKIECKVKISRYSHSAVSCSCSQGSEFVPEGRHNILREKNLTKFNRN
ncbi:unnamed protein product [Lactuca virosa]|uniref:Uncharacterized protein n=1 Tax=Lactuca virosa TaxID=75947 RepID=A0AAU9MLL2_9ASTR|nr:unnamed protein product [Lactuca virosa]